MSRFDPEAALNAADHVRDLLDETDSPSVTLDGHRAVIAGFRNSFATVHTLGRPSYGVEFAWQTAERVLTRTDNPGAFKS